MLPHMGYFYQQLLRSRLDWSCTRRVWRILLWLFICVFLNYLKYYFLCYFLCQNWSNVFFFFNFYMFYWMKSECLLQKVAETLQIYRFVCSKEWAEVHLSHPSPASLLFFFIKEIIFNFLQFWIFSGSWLLYIIRTMLSFSSFDIIYIFWYK